MRAVLALGVGLIVGILAGVAWLFVDHLAKTGLHQLGVGIRLRIIFSDWLTPAIGLGTALAAGYFTARLYRSAPMAAAAGVAAGLLAVFILPQALIRGDVSLYLAGPGVFIPTMLGLPILSLLGGRLGRRTTWQRNGRPANG
ncbi:MAG: hypothetical protein HZC23_02540 [Rhodocyclales bacterium]|nr:hypothetical protein [Rhodocyclales bacterium]